jgi:hypothetical protein
VPMARFFCASHECSGNIDHYRVEDRWHRAVCGMTSQVVGSSWKQVRSSSCLPHSLDLHPLATVRYCTRYGLAGTEHHLTRTPDAPSRQSFAIAIHTLVTIRSTRLFPLHGQVPSCRAPIFTAEDTRIGGIAILCLRGRLKWKAINGQHPYEVSDTVLEPNPTEAQGHHSSNLFMFGSMSTTYSSTVILWI